MGVKMRKLKIQYTIFVMLICIAFGSIVLTEKLRPIRNDDIDKKLQVYIEENYKDLKDITTEDFFQTKQMPFQTCPVRKKALK